MTRRLIRMLGLVGFGITLLVAGVVVLPASADLIFGAVDGAGTCTEHVPPIAGCAPFVDPLSPVELWKSTAGSGIEVTSEAFDLGLTPLNQALKTLALGPTQNGIGIASGSGGSPDLEIQVDNFVALLVTSPHLFTGTTSLTSLQAGEQAEVCAAPTATSIGVFGGATCVTSSLVGPEAQTFALPAAYSAANPWLLYHALSGDFNISDLDVPPQVVAEPTTLALFLTGVAGLVLARRQKHNKKLV